MRQLFVLGRRNCQLRTPFVRKRTLAPTRQLLNEIIVYVYVSFVLQSAPILTGFVHGMLLKLLVQVL